MQDLNATSNIPEMTGIMENKIRDENMIPDYNVSDDVMFKVVAVRYRNGAIEAYKLDTGEVIGKESAVALAHQGVLENIIVGVNRDGEETVRTKREGDKDPNIVNLSELPRF